MPHDTDHQARGASASDLAASAPDRKVEPAPSSDAEAARPIVVPAEAARPAADTPIVVPRGERPGRRWTRRGDDLPRGERWKRRLPEVCR